MLIDYNYKTNVTILLFECNKQFFRKIVNFFNFTFQNFLCIRTLKSSNYDIQHSIDFKESI